MGRSSIDFVDIGGVFLGTSSLLRFAVSLGVGFFNSYSRS
jgi:hypothetical protein